MNQQTRNHVIPQVTLHIAHKTKNMKMQECAILRNNVCLLQDSSMSSSFSLKNQLLTKQFFWAFKIFLKKYSCLFVSLDQRRHNTVSQRAPNEGSLVDPYKYDSFIWLYSQLMTAQFFGCWKNIMKMCSCLFVTLIIVSLGQSITEVF